MSQHLCLVKKSSGNEITLVPLCFPNIGPQIIHLEFGAQKAQREHEK